MGTRRARRALLDVGDKRPCSAFVKHNNAEQVYGQPGQIVMPKMAGVAGTRGVAKAEATLPAPAEMETIQITTKSHQDKIIEILFQFKVLTKIYAYIAQTIISY